MTQKGKSEFFSCLLKSIKKSERNGHIPAGTYKKIKTKYKVRLKAFRMLNAKNTNIVMDTMKEIINTSPRDNRLAEIASLVLMKSTKPIISTDQMQSIIQMHITELNGPWGNVMTCLEIPL